MKKASILIGKAIRKLSRLHGGGSALPGLVIEKLDPAFLGQVLEELPLGTVVISGTNGKTTTTRILTRLLEDQGLKVFTNPTGSNFVRGILSAVLEKIRPDGTFDYDIAVLELDEAHAVRFTQAIPISYALILNIQRDQLDRFCELDQTAALLARTTKAASKAVVLNREDPLVRVLPAKQVSYYGLSDKLRPLFPADEDLLSHAVPGPDLSAGQKGIASQPAYAHFTENACKANTIQDELPASLLLEDLDGHQARYQIDGTSFSCDLALDGVYNAFNAAGAMALCRLILPQADPGALMKSLSGITSAFGRSEVIPYGNTKAQLILVKNPSAFQLSLASFAEENCAYMIVINDHDADGRDVSWLWNVNFSVLDQVHTISGTRAADMALRLKYDEVPVLHVEEDLKNAISVFMEADGLKRIFATYTAMLEIRKLMTGRSLL